MNGHISACAITTRVSLLTSTLSTNKINMVVSIISTISKAINVFLVCKLES